MQTTRRMFLEALIGSTAVLGLPQLALGDADELDGVHTVEGVQRVEKMRPSETMMRVEIMGRKGVAVSSGNSTTTYYRKEKAKANRIAVNGIDGFSHTILELFKQGDKESLNDRLNLFDFDDFKAAIKPAVYLIQGRTAYGILPNKEPAFVIGRWTSANGRVMPMAFTLVDVDRVISATLRVIR